MDDAPCEDASSPSAVGLVTPISGSGPNYWIIIILGAHFRLFFNPLTRVCSNLAHHKYKSFSIVSAIFQVARTLYGNLMTP